jgi:hypothetical protein
MIIACATPAPYLLQPSATFKVRLKGPPVHILELYIVILKAEMVPVSARRIKGEKIVGGIVGLIDREFLVEFLQR